MSELGRANINRYNTAYYSWKRPTETAFGAPVVPLMLVQELCIISICTYIPRKLEIDYVILFQQGRDLALQMSLFRVLPPY